MKNTIYLILFVLGMILTSATTATIMTVKPALPKHVDSGWFFLDLVFYLFPYFRSFLPFTFQESWLIPRF